MPADGARASVRYELARGLALWAATFKVLPGRPNRHGGVSLDEAVAGLPRPARPWPPLEAGLFTHIDDLDGFEDAVDAPEPAREPVERALATLSAAFCRMLLRHDDVFAVPLVHTVTPIAGARTLLPYLPTSSVAGLYGSLWRVGAAITVSFTPPAEAPSRVLDGEPLSPGELVARAGSHGDPHVLKFTDACVGEYGLNPDPVYLLAAGHVLAQLSPW
jgi:hypothetical protein